MTEDDGKILYSFPKRSRGVPQDNAEFRARLSVLEVKGEPRTYADVRLWVIPKGGVELVATRKGVSVEIDSLPELLQAVQILHDAVKPRASAA